MNADPAPQFNGDIPVLVLLISFADEPSQGTTAGTWNYRYFADQVSSLRRFYGQASYGKVRTVPVRETNGTANDGVVGWIPLSMNHPQSGSRLPAIKAAIKAADPFVDFSAYDTNHDGVIQDTEMIVAAVMAGGALCPGDKSVGGVAGNLGSYAQVTDGTTVQSYHSYSETVCPNGDLSKRTAYTMGLVGHEFGHRLSWPDLYTRDGQPGLGLWDIMAHGNINQLPGNVIGTAPAMPDPFLRSMSGWLNPIQVKDTGTTTVTLRDSALYPDVLRILPNPNGVDWSRTQSGSGVYYLVEYRPALGYAAGLPGCGVLIWRVDEAAPTSNPLLDPNHRLLTLMQADGLNQLGYAVGGKSENEGDAGDPFPGSSNNQVFSLHTNPSSNLLDGTPTGVTVRVPAQSSCTAPTTTLNIETGDFDKELSLADTSVTEGNSGTKSATFTATLTYPVASPTTFTATTSNGTAVAGQDYTATTKTVTIPAGATSTTFTVPVTGDTTVENDETFKVTLSTNAANTYLKRPVATATIVNDDRSVSINDVVVGEGGGPARFTVTLNGLLSSSPVQVNVSTSDGTAIAGQDYTATAATLTIPARQRTATFDVPIIDNSAREGTESFNVNVTSASGAPIGDGQGLGTIIDND